jgi:TonB dependent receptor
VLKYFPSPNATPVNPYTNGANFVGNGVAPSSAYRTDTRVDHNWSSNWRTFARISWGGANSEQFNPFGNIAMPGDGGGTTRSSNASATVDNQVTLGPNVILNVRYGAGRTVSDRNPFGAGFDVTSIGLPAYLNVAAKRDQSLLPKFSFAGVVTDLGQANTRAFEATMVHSVVANVTAVRSRHNFKAGVDFRKMFINYYQFASPAGQFNFSQAWTQQEISTPSATAGSPLASFLLGLPNGGSASHAYLPSLASPYFAVYAQDDWKISRRLTFNAGLRYEIQYPRTERYDRMSVFDMTVPSPIAGKAPATACLSCGNLLGSMRFTGPEARTQFDPIYTDFGPRAGLAFAMTPKTVIRMAYGIMFPPSSLSAGGTSFGSSGFAGGTAATFTRDSFRTPATYLRDPFPDGFKFPLGRVGGAATDLGLGAGSSAFVRITSPYVQQWNFNIQRSLPGSITIEAGYLGSRGVNLLDGDSDAQPLNQLHASFMKLGSDLLRIVPNPFFGIITEPTSVLSARTVEYRQLLRPFPQYTSVNVTRQPLANSIYHAFTLRVERRFSQGLSFLLSFTGGKSIDDGSALAWWEGPTARTFLDAYNRRLERGVSSWDVSRRLVLSYVYELPFGKGKRFLGTMPRGVNLMIGGWQVNGIATVQTGVPLIIGVPQNNTFIYTQSQRADNNGASARISGGTRDQRLSRWFNTGVFSQPASFTLGNAGRTLPDVRNPGLHAHDISLFKNNFFGPDGRLNLQYRLEMFSALNQPQFGGPATLVGSPTFGTISGAGGSRQIQMALKLLW